MKPNKSGPFIIMKTLKSSALEFTNLVSKSIKEFRDSYTAEVNSIRIDLLKKISEDYGISFEELASKYIKKSKINLNKDDDFNPSMMAIDTYDDNSDILSDELLRLKDNTSDSATEQLPEFTRNKIELNLLHKCVHDGNTYYVENKEPGNVYDIDLNIVGIYSDGNIDINIELANKYKVSRKNKKYGDRVQKFIDEYDRKINDHKTKSVIAA
jgi:hypothetical protein